MLVNVSPNRGSLIKFKVKLSEYQDSCQNLLQRYVL